MSVRITTLPNGLTVLTDNMPQVETVSLGLWANVGTRDEEPEVNGVAHLLEHMAFKGTSSRSARDIADQIEDVGGHLNAYTTREQTAYYAKVLADDTSLATDILTDILRNSVFDPEELARERAVVLQEIGQAEDTPDDIVFDHFQATAYPDQPLGRPVLGTAEVVERLTAQDITRYLQGHYGAGSVIAAAAGRVDHDRFVSEVAARMGDLPPVSLSNGPAAEYRGGSFREERDLEQVHLVVGFPGVASDHADYYALSVYSTLLGGGMSSRLFQEIREKRGLVYSVYSFASSYRDGGLFGVYAGTGPEELGELVPILAAELAKSTDGISQRELDRAKAQLRAGTLMARESTSARVETLAQNYLVHNRLVDLEETLEKLAEVTVADVQRLARQVVAAPPTVTLLGPSTKADPLSLLQRHLQ
jgi:predicted Zn-dependent peptidase